jgi:GntR family transcriptional regulator
MPAPSPDRSMTTAVPALEAGGMALHRQLFLVLREQIRRGALAVGQALPTEQALGEQFGVSRITVRRALQDLSDQGFVQRRQGRGTYVLARGDTPIAPPPALSVRDGLRKAQLETNAEVVDLALRIPPPPVGTALDLTAGSEALYVLRTRTDKANGEPLMISEAWLPPRFSKLVSRNALARHPLYEILAEGGVTMGRVAQELTAEIADPSKARLLRVSIGAALLRVNRLVYDADGLPVQHLALFLSPERSRILMDIPAEHLDTAQSGLVAHDVRRV